MLGLSLGHTLNHPPSSTVTPKEKLVLYLYDSEYAVRPVHIDLIELIVNIFKEICELTVKHSCF